MGLRRAHSLAWILSRRYFLPSSYFWSGGSFEAFENALSNFALWAEIIISALKGACAIQNFDLKELSHKMAVPVHYTLSGINTGYCTEKSSRNVIIRLFFAFFREAEWYDYKLPMVSWNTQYLSSHWLWRFIKWHFDRIGRDNDCVWCISSASVALDYLLMYIVLHSAYSNGYILLLPYKFTVP